jgi:hypothetical protein
VVWPFRRHWSRKIAIWTKEMTLLQPSHDDAEECTDEDDKGSHYLTRHEEVAGQRGSWETTTDDDWV